MDAFSVLADPTRRSIVEMLAAERHLSAGDISSRFDSSAPAISQHLKVLREANLVQVKKKAQQRIYSINPAAFDDMWEWLNHVRRFWDERFDALDEFLKSEQEKEK